MIKIGNSRIFMGEVIITSNLWGSDEKNHYIEGWSWFKFNNLGLALGLTLKLYTSVEKGFKLKVKKFWRINSTFVEVTGEKLVGEAFLVLNSLLLHCANLVFYSLIFIFMFFRNMLFYLCRLHLWKRWSLYQMF